MRPLLAALALACLASCGFRPVYAGAGAGGDVYVEDIPGRNGHALRKALLRDLSGGLPGASQGATLSVDLQERVFQLAFRPDGAASRSSVQATARYVLALEDTAISGTVETETSFNVPDAPYGDISAQVSASERAMGDLSRRMVQDLRLKLGDGA